MTAPDDTVEERDPAAADDLVVSGWSTISPYGCGNELFGEGVLEGRSAIARLDPRTHPGPSECAGIIPDFSARTALGKKGTRVMDRITAIAVSAVGRLLQLCEREVSTEPERTALVLGTSAGSVQSIMDFTRDSLTGEKPYHVDPARFPNVVLNRAAGQSAIWHGVKGPNTTIAGGRLTGLLALSYAVRLYRGRRCDRVLCGVAEEYSEQRSWLEWHNRDEHAAPVLGEGAVMFLVEASEDAVRAGRTPLLRIRTTRFMAFDDPSTITTVLTRCVVAALDHAGADPGEVRIVAPTDSEGDLDKAERAAVTEVVGNDAEWLRCRPLIGDTSGASAGFQAGLVLAAAERGDLRAGELALVTGVERDGTVGCALFEACG